MRNQSASLLPPNFFEVVLRHKKKILFVPVLIVVGGALFFVFCPRTYRSESRLFLRLGRESVGMDPTATTGQTMSLYTSDREDEVKSVEGIFNSRSVAATVVDRLGADVVLGRAGIGASKPHVVADFITKPISIFIAAIKSVDPISEREEAIIKLERGLSIAAERQAMVIVVQYKANSPQLAQMVCQAIVDAARHEHIRVHRDAASRTFFADQQKRLREKLDHSLDALRNAKNDVGLASVDQRRATLESQYGAIALDRLSTDQQLATAQAQIENIQKQLAEIPERIVSSKRSVPNQGADMLRDRFFELQVQSMDLQARYSDSHPLVMAVNDQLDEADKVLAAQAELRVETTDDINPIYHQLSLAMKQEQSVVAGLNARIIELDRQTKTVLADLRTLNEHELKIDQFAREADLARDKYLQYARNLEEARIDKDLEDQNISNIGVVQSATLAEKPVFPSRLLTVAGTFALAVAGTVGLVLLGERQNWPAPAASVQPRNGRGVLRRRARRQLGSETNDHSEDNEMSIAPK